MTAKFSPGPWRVETSRDGDIRIVDANGEPLIESTHTDGPGSVWTVKSMDDARLMAEAKKMYELLQRAVVRMVKAGIANDLRMDITALLSRIDPGR